MTLRIHIPKKELFDERSASFIPLDAASVELEHSLVSISEWESKWKLPLLSQTNPTKEQTKDYIKCMTLGTPPMDIYYELLTKEHYESIQNYMNDSMTATTFSNLGKSKGAVEVVTSEVIYYWMLTNNIPFECQHWHINRLLTLIQVAIEKQKGPQKMSSSEAYAKQRELNEARRRALGSTG